MVSTYVCVHVFILFLALVTSPPGSSFFRSSISSIYVGLNSKGADLNARDSLGRTPVICATRELSPSLVHFLVKRGARLDIIDEEMKTALHHLCQGVLNDKKVVEIADTLIQESSSLLVAVDAKGQTPLMYACRKRISGIDCETVESHPKTQEQDSKTTVPSSSSLVQNSESEEKQSPEQKKAEEAPLIQLLRLFLKSMSAADVCRADSKGLVRQKSVLGFGGFLCVS